MNSLTNTTDNMKYCLTSIEKTEPPENMPEGDWYHYVVMYGSSAINCVKSGTLLEVTRHAEDFVDSLNARATMGYTSYAARKPKTKNA